jgi:DNA-binding protein HU-beta
MATCVRVGCGQEVEGEGSYCRKHTPNNPGTIRKIHPGRSRMTQSEVINHFAEQFGVRRVEVKEFFDELHHLAAREVKSKGEFVLPGFGKLVKSERKAREGRNPASGETIQIPVKTTLKFRVGKSMKDTVLPKK